MHFVVAILKKIISVLCYVNNLYGKTVYGSIQESNIHKHLKKHSKEKNIFQNVSKKSTLLSETLVKLFFGEKKVFEALNFCQNKNNQI